MIRLDPIECPINRLGNFPINLEIIHFTLKPRRGIKPHKHIAILGILSLLADTFAFNISRDIENVRHIAVQTFACSFDCKGWNLDGAAALLRGGVEAGLLQVPDGNMVPPIRPITRGFGARPEGTKFADKTATSEGPVASPEKSSLLADTFAFNISRDIENAINTILKLVMPAIQKSNTASFSMFFG